MSSHVIIYNFKKGLLVWSHNYFGHRRNSSWHECKSSQATSPGCGCKYYRTSHYDRTENTNLNHFLVPLEPLVPFIDIYAVRLFLFIFVLALLTFLFLASTLTFTL
jgi:hypothetical protein